MRKIVTVVTILAAFSAAPAGADPAAIDGSLLQQGSIVEAFAKLVARSGYGRFDIEQAAFVRLLPDGTFAARVWPSHRGFQRATFTGAIPEGTVAIAHTHPLGIPRPSRHDLELAARLGIAVLVLTPRNITLVRPDGAIVTLLRNKPWAPGARSPLSTFRNE